MPTATAGTQAFALLLAGMVSYTAWGEGACVNNRRTHFSWFDLTKYDMVSAYTMEDWHCAISNRLNHWEILTADEDRFYSCTRSDILDFRKGSARFWEFVRLNGAFKSNFASLCQDVSELKNDEIEISSVKQRAILSRLGVETASNSFHPGM